MMPDYKAGVRISFNRAFPVGVGEWFNHPSWTEVQMAILKIGLGILLGSLTVLIPLPAQAPMAPVTPPGVGQTWEDPKSGLELVQIPAGSFQMGTNATDTDSLKHSRPVHAVTLTTPFWMARTPVTVGQFRAFVEASGYRTQAEVGNGSYARIGSKWELKADANWRNPYFVQEETCPVVCVSWTDAQVYLQWLNGKSTDMTYRLPTEAEWEYACRAGTTDERYGDLDAIAWFAANSGNTTHPVGQKQPNAFGLYDMLGNVLHWCQDWWSDTYSASGASKNPQGPTNGKCRVFRGGSWLGDALFVRSAYRSCYPPSARSGNLGFRVVAVARNQ